MGRLYEFRCSACGYAPKVSGRPDVGMTFRTTTVVCETCRELLDVGRSGKPGERRGEPPIRKVQCPGCGTLSLKRWTHPGPCPKCGHRDLMRGELVMLWD